MKVLLCGCYNPHFLNTIVLREKALEYLGHTVSHFDDKSYVLPGRIREAIFPLHQWDMRRLNRALVAQVKRDSPDVCILKSSHRPLDDGCSFRF
jgi:hypothetical protein